ncbi:hypothetical protein LIER_19286 [Lithospermum erythrorhizon]|uniref:Knottins-like domain-containing protein n=1 Tax=Lithospermum erythrorhizon TaxID=34254 RepID=A0AAV3QK52_LITER
MAFKALLFPKQSSASALVQFCSSLITTIPSTLSFVGAVHPAFVVFRDNQLFLQHMKCANAFESVDAYGLQYSPEFCFCADVHKTEAATFCIKINRSYPGLCLNSELCNYQCILGSADHGSCDTSFKCFCYFNC